MFQRNTKLFPDGRGFSILVIDPELDSLYKRYKGLVHIRIDRPQTEGTEEQNRAAHALLSAYYATGLHSAPDGTSLEEFKVQKKLDYGPHWDIKFQDKIVPVPKSWADFTKLERSHFIDSLISEIIQVGAGTDKKIMEILTGMEENSLGGHVSGKG